MTDSLRTRIRYAIMQAIPLGRAVHNADVSTATDNVLAELAPELDHQCPIPAGGETGSDPVQALQAPTHVAELGPDGWQLEHGADCADVATCPVAARLAKAPAPRAGRGRWLAHIENDRLTFTALRTDT